MARVRQLCLADERDLLALVSNRRPKKIGIDGASGAGKTTLAEHLAQDLGYGLVPLDDYVVTNSNLTVEEEMQLRQDGFVKSLEYPRLRADLRGKRTFVVEGACLLAVLRQLKRSLDMLIYVKRLQGGCWSDNPALISEQARSGRALHWFEHEVLVYHLSYEPQLHAQVVFCRDADTENRREMASPRAARFPEKV